MTIRYRTLGHALGRPTVHPFPARMAPGLALRALERLKRGSVVVDPMAGSGTVLALARHSGHRAIGFDLDPLAVTIASTWTRTVASASVRETAALVFDGAVKDSQLMGTAEAYPEGSDEESREFVRFWFDGRARLQLAALARRINAVREHAVRDVLWCALSRMIITKQAGVSRALDLSHSRPHRSFETAPRRPFDEFMTAVGRVLSGCLTTEVRERGPAARCTYGDARAVPLESQCADLVFTSPPYLNAIDYMRCSKFTLVWMGYSVSAVAALRAASIGTERGASVTPAIEAVLQGANLLSGVGERFAAILRRYAADSFKTLCEVQRVLRPGGNAVFVLGENTVRGTFVPTGRLFSLLGELAGLQRLSRRVRDLPRSRRYLPPPGATKSDLDGRMRREVILRFARDGS